MKLKAAPSMAELMFFLMSGETRVVEEEELAIRNI
jgi:hypothetical protein